ncbi:MAG TPA: hypothetical protein VF952_00950 [Chloroflexia bacterium]|jgi:hypothetical protein
MSQQEFAEKGRGRTLLALIAGAFAPRRVVQLALALALLTAAVDLPNRFASAGSVLSVTRLWADPDAQHQAQIADAPQNLLRAADAILPRDAVVLLVTSGQDVGRREYITYHRALYLLEPRPVWWLSPAPSDGSWKARWWISAPLTADTIRAVATEMGAGYVLVYEVSPPIIVGRKVADFGAGYLLQVDDESQEESATPARQEYAGAAWPLQVAGALAVMLLLGNLALAWVARLGYSPRGVERWALAWAIGAGLTTTAMFWLDTFGLGLYQQIAVLTLLAAGWAGWKLVVFATRWGSRKHRQRVGALVEVNTVAGETEGTSRLHRALRLLLLIFLSVEVVFVAVAAVGRPLTVWDSWVNWSMKARMIFLEGGITPRLYSDASRTVTHLDYPLLVPLSEAWFYGWLGAPDDRLVGLLSVCFYLALAGVCYAAARAGGVGRTTSLAACVVVASMSYIQGLAGIVFAEVQLALYATIAAVYLVKWLRGGPAGSLAIAALGAGMMPWTKREGLVLLLAIGIATLALNLNRRRAWLGVGSLGVGAVLFAGPWWTLIAANRVVNASFMPLTAPNFLANLDRLPTIAQLERDSLLNFGWSFIWPLALLCGLLTWRHARRSIEILPATAVLYILMTWVMYIFSTYVPYEQHILSSIDRLVAHVVPLVVVWIALRGAHPAAGREGPNRDATGLIC